MYGKKPMYKKGGVFKHGGTHTLKYQAKDQGWEDAVKRVKSAKKPK